MVKVIDLVDSDDESPNVSLPEKRPKLEETVEPMSTTRAVTPLSTVQQTKISSTGINSSKSATPPPLPESTTLTSTIATTSTTNSTFTSPSSTTGTNSTNTSPSSSNANKTARHRSRKTPHQTIRISPDMQFETISLDDEDQTPATLSTEDLAPSVTLPVLPPKGASKGRPTKNIQALRKTTDLNSRDTLIKAVSDRFIERPETAALIRKMAADRVRVNFLMNSFNLPEINFGQSSHIEMLRFQLRDRLKQRRIRILTEELEQQVRTRQVLQLQQEKEDQEQRIQQQMDSLYTK